jgi:hypothetical protein
MAFNAGPHLIICGFGSGDEGFVIIRGREFQGVFTLAASATPVLLPPVIKVILFIEHFLTA